MPLIANYSDGQFSGYWDIPLDSTPIGETVNIPVPLLASFDISPILSSINFKLVQLSWFAEIYMPDILASTPKYKSAVAKYALGSYDIWSNTCIVDSGFLNYICQRTPNYNCWLNETVAFAMSPFSPTIEGSVDFFATLGKFANGNMRRGNGISVVASGAGYSGAKVTLYYIAQLVELISPSLPTYSAEI